MKYDTGRERERFRSYVIIMPRQGHYVPVVTYDAYSRVTQTRSARAFRSSVPRAIWPLVGKYVERKRYEEIYATREYLCKIRTRARARSTGDVQDSEVLELARPERPEDFTR